jgi:hypothetical protein
MCHKQVYDKRLFNAYADVNIVAFAYVEISVVMECNRVSVGIWLQTFRECTAVMFKVEMSQKKRREPNTQ